MCRRDCQVFFFNDTATTEIYTLSLHDALPIYDARKRSSALQTARKDLEVLEDEQQRLDYRLASARETLRVAQAARYVLGDDDEVTVSIDDPDVPDVPILVLRADSETVAEGGAASFTIETTVELVEDRS